jgi:hypothetical protein
MSYCLSPRIAAADPRWELADSDVIEIPLLLPASQVSALEALAHRRGVTAAALVRGLLAEFLSAGQTPQTDTAI